MIPINISQGDLHQSQNQSNYINSGTHQIPRFKNRIVMSNQTKTGGININNRYVYTGVSHIVGQEEEGGAGPTRNQGLQM